MTVCNIKRFNYKLPVSSAILMVLSTLAVTVGMAYIAYSIHNFHSYKIWVLLRLFSLHTLQHIFWGMTIFSLFATVIIIYVAVRSQTSLSYIEFGSLGILVPKASLSMVPILIPYKAITQVRVIEIKGQQIAIISSTVGESRLLAKSFVNTSEFTQFLRILQEHRQG